MDTQNHACYLGIDVGTGSARAGVFDRTGALLGTASHDIQLWQPEAGFAEQSSDDIWRAVGRAVRAATAEAGVAPEQVRGIGCDATCSLVALDADDRPVTLSPTGRDEQNIIVWMDHRALDQTERINATQHAVLRYVGGRISPEMQTPKLLWLSEHLPRAWQRVARFFDLPDFLTYRATGDDTRSLCSTVCKWTYLAHPPSGPGHAAAAAAPTARPGDDAADALPPLATDDIAGWEATFFRQVGLGELVEEGFRRIGTRILPMGRPLGQGLTATAAAEWQLRPGTPVSVSIIDAHAGGLGLLGTPLDGGAPGTSEMETRLALIGGTSTCHMAVARRARFVPGVWGPYFSAMIPGLWLTEGGQSATGALIDHVIFSHARGADLRREADAAGRTAYDLLNERLARLAADRAFPAELTRHLHVLPYFHGNRSPRADATLRGTVSGLTLDDSVNGLALLYLATVQAIAHGTRHIIDTLNRHGYRIATILACGGGTKNPVFLREHADVSGCRIVLPREPQAVLLGAAILGAVAAGDCPSVLEAMARMSGPAETIVPGAGAVAEYHRAKHAVFHRLCDDQMAYRSLMND
jgi:ribulose kinase